MPDLNFDDIDRVEHKQEDQARKRYEYQLNAHPDCADPDHPGCKYCDDEHEDGENE